MFFPDIFSIDLGDYQQIFFHYKTENNELLHVQSLKIKLFTLTRVLSIFATTFPRV